MSIEEIHAGALQLPEDQRAILAGELLTSLPSLLVDDDQGVAEAKRRSREMDENPDTALTWEQVKSGLGR